MAEIEPFQGYRFASADLNPLIAPPYDMLDDAKVDALYARDPHNAVRIDQNRKEAADDSNRVRHERGGAFFADWVKEGVLVRDDSPCLYVYEQKFSIEQAGEEKTFTRTGVISLVKLVDFADKVVLPHEYTLSGPKVDRYEHLDATRLNVGQIFGLLSDDGGKIFKIIRSMRNHLVGKAVDGDGVEHVLFRCADLSLIEAYKQAAKSSTILIADGHHRYETALNFSREHENAFDHVMMTLVSMDDPGLVIRSFHRLVRRQASVSDMVKALESNYTLKNLGPATLAGINSFLAGTVDATMLYADAATRTLYALTLNEGGERFLETTMPERSKGWKHLDVSQINTIVINRILDLPLDGHVLHDTIEYVNDPALALERCMDATGFYGGFFIRPAVISTIHRIVAGDERMPQKSTNFYPKLYSGLVMNRLGEA